MKGKQAVAKGGKEAIEALVRALVGGGIPAETRDSGSVCSAWVVRDKAEPARVIVEGHQDVRLVSAVQSAYELCVACGYDHGPGATHCQRCGAYVRA